MRSRGFALAAAVTAFVAGAMTLLPWVSLEGRGLPMSWSGLGFYYGAELVPDTPSINPLGWAVVFVVFEALVLLGFELFATGEAAALKRWLYLGLASLAGVLAVALVVAVLVPSMVYGSMPDHLAAAVGDIETAEITLGRGVLGVPAILGTAFWLALTAVVALRGFRAAGRVDETQSAA